MSETTPSRILVVDDNATNRRVLSRSLEKAGYEALVANDGFQAVEMAARHRPDIILLDVMMPGRSGVETCRIFKAQKETAAIPVIFVTAVSDAKQILEAFAAGGCDYVTKPFRSEEVLARVSVHVRMRQAEEALRRKHRQAEDLARRLAEANVELARLSRVDPLTKLLNRRTWEEAVLREHSRFQRQGCPYSIVMMDIDHFKAFNDSQGHQAGDECLRRVAEAVVAACRQVDMIGRYGGEEFVILAPHTRAEAAVQMAERVRKAVWALGIPHSSGTEAGRVTVSLGVAGIAGDSWEDVLKRADDALYIAKRAGRDMVYGDRGISASVGDPGTTEGSNRSRDSVTAPPEPLETVLVVDDDPTNRAVCKGCLERAGYRVGEAVDGQAAMTSVGEEPPDVIIMDIMMPRMDGLECTRRLKADPDTRDIPIIIVSALGEGDDILAGLDAGADEYLAKPIRTTELLLRIRSMAGLHRERRDLLRSCQLRGEHVRILTSLVEFCRAVGVSHHLDEVLEHTVAVVTEVARSRRVSIMIPDSERRHLTIRKSTGIDEGLAATVRVPVGQAIAGEVFASGRPVVINTARETGFDHAACDSPFFASVPLLSAPLGTSGRVVGVLNVTDRVGHQPYEPYELEYIELIAKVTAGAIQDILARDAHEWASDSIMVGLAQLAEHRDNDTGMHLERVTRYCHMLAEELRKDATFRDWIDDTFMYNLVRAVPLHDIGKVAIPDQILRYPGRLSNEQRAIMETHAAIGAQTIRSLIERTPGVDFLVMAADIAHYHHEWYDGSGYPAGLKADAIPLSARVAALADVYDALTTERVYKEAYSHDKAVAIVVEGSGSQFDPAVVDAFVKREKQFAELSATMADELPPDGAIPSELEANAHRA